MKFKPVILEETSAYEKVQHWFFAFPDKEFSLTDLIREGLPISKTSAYAAVKRLEKEGFLIVERAGKTLQIRLNKEHPYNFSRKVPYHLRLIMESGIVEQLDKRYLGRAIILFGSNRKGEDNEKSDVDIAVEIAGDAPLVIEELGVLPKLGYRSNVPVNLAVFSRKNISLELFNNIANGIVLSGFLEVYARPPEKPSPPPLR